MHDLRRRFVTDAENSGVPRYEAMKLSGHRSEAVYKRYAISNPEQVREALAHIDQYRAEKLRHTRGTLEGSSKQELSVSQ
jgi:hypothetical protein